MNTTTTRAEKLPPIIAYKPAAGLVSLNIHAITECIDARVYYALTGAPRLRSSLVRYSSKGAYFTAYGRREYLQDFMRAGCTL